MIPPILADCSKPLSECRRHNIGLRGGRAHPTSNCALHPYAFPPSYSASSLHDTAAIREALAGACKQLGLTQGLTVVRASAVSWRHASRLNWAQD
jgi:hypothetical protein